MKILLLTFALLAAVSADVSHLNNMYLPPDQGSYGSPSQHIDTYEQQQPAETAPAEEQYQASNEYAIDVRGSSEADTSQYAVYEQEAGAASEAVPNNLIELFHPASAQSGSAEQAEANQFVPQTYGSSIEYSNVAAEGIFGANVGNSIEYGQEAASSSSSSSSSAYSGIDTQYGANGGYIY